MAALPTLVTPETLDPELARRLTDLFARGTPANTVRAYERDLIYIAAWKAAAFAAPLAWPEAEPVALRFVLDHAEDLTAAAPEDEARQIAETLVAQGLRRSLARPAPATLDRRIASWRAFHGFRNLASPFESPVIRRARAAARRAAAHRPTPKATKPIDRAMLERLVAACPPTLAGLGDRALLETAWGSGGRRRSELAALRLEDLDLESFNVDGLVRINLLETKTTEVGRTPRLVLADLSARTLVAWLEAAAIVDGPVFRAVSKADRVLERGLSSGGVGAIIKSALRRAGYEAAASSAHGLRAGFLTQAAKDGVPLQAAARLSLHRSLTQAARYYQDAELAENPAVTLRRGSADRPVAESRQSVDMATKRGFSSTGDPNR
jgi:integrase